MFRRVAVLTQLFEGLVNVGLIVVRQLERRAAIEAALLGEVLIGAGHKRLDGPSAVVGRAGGLCWRWRTAKDRELADQLFDDPIGPLQVEEAFLVVITRQHQGIDAVPFIDGLDIRARCLYRRLTIQGRLERVEAIDLIPKRSATIDVGIGIVHNALEIGRNLRIGRLLIDEGDQTLRLGAEIIQVVDAPGDLCVADTLHKLQLGHLGRVTVIDDRRGRGTRCAHVRQESNQQRQERGAANQHCAKRLHGCTSGFEAE